MRRALLALAILVALFQCADAETRHTAAVILTYADAPAPLVDTMPRAREIFAQVDSFYAEQSYGLFTPITDVYGILTIERPPTGLTADQTRTAIAAGAQAALQIAGVNLQVYWFGGVCAQLPCAGDFIYVSPASNIGAGGFGANTAAWVGSGESVSAPPFQLAAHELGHHYYGWNHDDGMFCADLVCPQRDRFDSLSVMGYGNGHVSPQLKRQAGWLIPLVAQGGDYLIAPYELAGGVKVLQVTGGTKKRPLVFTVSYRQPLGFDRVLSFANSSNVFSGVLIQWVGVQLRDSVLLAMNPSTGNNLDHPALMVGQSWCDPSGRVLSIAVLSVSPAGALIRVGKCR